jgi:hypothetical protein
MTRQEFEFYNYRGFEGTQKVAGMDWVTGLLAFSFTDWDADMIQACICDEGYEGSDCATTMRCPKGDDPLTLGQADEMQILECVCDDGTCDDETFKLGFRRTGLSQTVQWTDEISVLAVASELETALIALPAISGGVSISVGGLLASTTDSICAAAGQSTGITFTHTPGNLDPLFVVTTSGSLTIDVLVDDTPSTMTAIGDEITAITGEREYVTCSGRGYCVDGEYCSCFDNFNSSSGAVGEKGGRADCGFFTGTTVTQSDCPKDTNGNICFGHGTCVGYANVCICDPGYTGKLCQARECESGNSFFAYEDGVDHDDEFYCSNRGSCDTDTGACSCMEEFGGDACEYLMCPTNASSSECSSHGTCTPLSSIASSNGDDYTSPWDATQIYGCVCDTDVYVGPFSGEISDYSGYLCDQLSCPSGDDPMSTNIVEDVECSNRGRCDHSTGHCNCFAGFCSSNGTAGFSGIAGDCSFKSVDCTA